MIERDSPSVRVRVWLLGTFHVERRQDETSWKTLEPSAWGNSYTRYVLNYLLCAQKRKASRSDIIDALWPERELHLAEKYLNNASSRLYRLFHQEGILTPFGSHGRTGYQLAGQEVLWTDIDECEALLREAERLGRTSSQALLLLEQASQHVERGSLLEGESGQWSLASRAEKETVMRCCLLWLAEVYEAQGMLWHMRRQYRMLLEANPLDEDILCRLLAMLHRHGMTHDARTTYEEAKRRFIEYGLSLSATTNALAEKLLHEPLSLDRYLLPFTTSDTLLRNGQYTIREEELGFMDRPSIARTEEKANTHQSPSLLSNQDSELQEILSLLTAQSIMKPVDEGESIDVNKLRRLLLLGMSRLTVEIPIAVEEFILQCTSSLKACWHLLRGKGLYIAEEMLSTYIPTLTKLAFSLSKFQEPAAGLATQAKILQAILAMHKLNFVAREMYCHEAVQCSRLSADDGLQAAALMYLAYTYIRCPPSRPEKAVPTFLAALNVLGKEISLLRSDIYMGLAVASAQCREEQKAVEFIDLAHMHFPQYPEQDPRFLYADCGWFELRSDTGKMYLDLASHYPDRGYDQKAYEIFTQLSGLQSAAERNTNETVIRQADAARGLGDLDLYVDCLERGARMAFSLGSQKYYSEAYDVFQRTPEQWRHEQKIQTLADDVFRQLPGRRGDE